MKVPSNGLNVENQIVSHFFISWNNSIDSCIATVLRGTTKILMTRPDCGRDGVKPMTSFAVGTVELRPFPIGSHRDLTVELIVFDSDVLLRNSVTIWLYTVIAALSGEKE